MTLNEFLQDITIEYDLDGNKILPHEYKLQFEYEEEQGNESHYVIDEVIEIDINTNTKTITLKGK